MSRFDPELLAHLGLPSWTTDDEEVAQAIANVSRFTIRPAPDDWRPNPRVIAFFLDIAISVQEALWEKRRHVHFGERAEAAAKGATPWDFEDVAALALPLGLGRRVIKGGEVIEVLQAIRDLIHQRARQTALAVLEQWERQGRLVRIDRHANSA